MEKVKVTKEVAEAIEALRKAEKSNEEILRTLAEPNNGWCGAKSKILNTTPFDLVAKALYIGYEVEKTPEENLSEIYKKALSDAHMHDGWNEWTQAVAERNKAKGIKLALDTLGIHIEGVNA